MKRVTMMLYCILLGYYSLNAQNPNWTLPPQNFDAPDLNFTILPKPSGANTYNGAPADYVHAGYTGPDGELQFFTVDEYVYDKDGYKVGELRKGGIPKAGFNKRLILAMGDDFRLFYAV